MTIQHRLNNIPRFQYLLPLLFFLAGCGIIYSYGCFEFDPDEGINLMKAFLLYKGFPLYQEIWNDQPPILTHLLALGFQFVEPRVEFARTFILICSTILLWQTWLILYLLGGVLHAYIGCLFLLIAPNYWKLSISVMVGLPCITIALGAVLSIVVWHATQKNFWLIVSALLLSISILTKLFTFFLAPIILVGIVCSLILPSKKISSKQLQPAALWMMVFFGSSILILLSLVGIENIHLLINNHTSAREIDAFQNMALRHSLRNDYRLFLVGLTIWGAIAAYQRQQWQVFYFASWSLVAYQLLINHRPIWYHQVLLLHIPAIIMAGYTLGEIITVAIGSAGSYFRFNRRLLLALFTIALLYASVLLIGEQTKTTTKEIKSWRKACNKITISTSLDRQFLGAINQYDSQTDWIVTDSPMFAFRAGITVPPSTAVLSRKQLETGNITDEQLIKAIQQYQPEQILFKRFEWASLTSFLEQNYQLKMQQDNFRLYVRRKEDS